MLSRRLLLNLALVCFSLLSSCTSAPRPPAPELLSLHLEGLTLLSQHRFEDAEKTLLKLVEKSPSHFVPRFNLAVAQLNQAEKGADRALQTLEKARQLQPDDARVAYTLGIVHRFIGAEEVALGEFERALRHAPRDADCHYQVAIGLIRTGRSDEALPHFEMAVQLDPTIRGAWNNLQLAWRRAGRIEDADRALATFRDLESSGTGRAHSTKYTEQGKLAEAIRDWRPPSASRHLISSGDVPELMRITGPREGGAAPFALVDTDLNCIPDLWIAGDEPAAWDLTAEPKKIASLPALEGAISFAIGDVDEDGIADLAISDGKEVRIQRGEAGRTPDFAEKISTVVAAATDLMLADIDMEGDLDLLLANGKGPIQLSLNEGRNFRSLEDSPDLGSRQQVDKIIAVRDLDRDHDPDLLLAGETLSWISGAPQWKFSENPEQRPLTAGAPIAATSALLVDVDGQLGADLVLLQDGKLRILRQAATVKDAPGKAIFDDEVSLPAEITSETFETIATADLDLDGTQEILLGGTSRTVILHHMDGAPLLSPRSFPAAVNIVVGDLDGDGDPDLILEKSDGSLWLLRNDLDIVSHQLHTFRAHLGGQRDGDDRRTNLLGFGARLELRNPDHTVLAFQEGSRGHNARGLLPVVVGINTATHVSSLIIEWTDGVLQAEMDLAADQCQRIEEVQRKSSSCPVLFTFDGQKWQFITDFMGGGGLGSWIGPEEYAPPEPTEVVRIDPDALTQVGDRLRLSVMEPMQEICYADRLQLLAVDHPATQSCYPEEYFPMQSQPPSGKPLLLHQVDRVFPVGVQDASGPVEASRVRDVDRIYAGPRALVPDLVGYCEDQVWEFTFESVPEGQRVALFLDGWIEYPYSRINFAAWQGSRRLSAPTFRWRKDAEEPWQLLGKEIGYPAGMPKTMVLDVSDIVARGAREIRIESNLELYWDRVFLASVKEPMPAQVHTIPLHSALLRDGGYPREYSEDGQLPATYHYEMRDATLDYRAMERGHVTRHGRVDELLTEIDDRFVVIGGGDELLLEYDASTLPELPDGWQRTWLFDTFGWCKDLDPLTGARDSVEPLPFRAMNNYPPRPEDEIPDRTEYQRIWNTRRD
ncbi:MAG: ASPIC/UnbV domain-containing protein [Planctomycetota bacterium]|nr:ASPIC/UnbV domain-containing protein [Planctomycetota bacterium]